MRTAFYFRKFIFFLLMLIPGYIYSQSWGLSGNATSANDFLGVTNGFDLIFKTTHAGNLLERMRVTENGNFGFGTSFPSGNWTTGTVLHLKSFAPEFRMSTDNDSTSLSFFNTSNAFIHSNRSIVFLLDSAEENYFTVARRNNNSNFQTDDNTPLMKLSQAGMLYVRGLKVTVDSFPDYVFDTEYTLMPIAELKEYIKVNRRLPDMPSAKHVYREGLDVGESQKIMLRKIEELTLYIIRLQEEVQSLRAIINERK
jgi:hypothetical protein